MDKFVVKTPRSDLPGQSSPEDSPLKQATLESLKGVVLIDDILKYKNAFESPNTDNETVLSYLKELSNKQPSKEVLLSTGIGKTIHKLCRHKDPEISSLAENIYQSWKGYIINKYTQTNVEVKYDLKTEHHRATARKWLSVSLQEDSESTEGLSKLIEMEVFQKSKKLINKKYNKAVRKITFALKNENLQKQLKSEEMSVQELVEIYYKE